jgi:hypothetical protein
MEDEKNKSREEQGEDISQAQLLNEINSLKKALEKFEQKNK